MSCPCPSFPTGLTLSRLADRETHQKPVKTRDALTGHQIRLKIYCNCAPGDNPSQSETSGHIGGKGNHPCRKCQVGGSQKEKETSKGFHEMFTVWKIMYQEKS